MQKTYRWKETGVTQFSKGRTTGAELKPPSDILLLARQSIPSSLSPYDMLGLSRRSFSHRCWTHLSRPQVRSKATAAPTLPEVIVRPSVAKHGICGLEIHVPRDITTMTKDVLTQCGTQVSRLQQYEQLSASEVCPSSFLLFTPLYQE